MSEAAGQRPATFVYRIRPGMSAEATGEVGGPPKCGVNLWTKSDSVCTPASSVDTVRDAGVTRTNSRAIERDQSDPQSC